LSNVDGQIAGWVLDEHQYRKRQADGDEVPFRFVDQLDRAEGPGYFLPPLVELELGGAATRGDYTVEKVDPRTAVARYTHPATGVQIERRYTLAEDTYRTDVQVTLRNPGVAAVPYDLAVRLRGAQNDAEAGGGLFSPPIYLFESVCRHADDFERAPAKKVADALTDADEPTRFADGVRWAGVDNRYFMTALMPQAGEAEACDFDLGAEPARVKPDAVPPGFTMMTTRVDLTGGELGPGAEITRSFSLYGGPKKLAALRAQDPPLDDAIDFGFFAALCVPLLWLMRMFHGIVGNWGVAIILLTVLVKLLTLPLTHKQYKSMAGMKKVQPELKKLQEKYKDDKIKLQQEMMKLYRENKVSPLAGCLPMLMMMPIYFSLYRTIYSAVELYQADFVGWIHDLSQQDPYYVTPVLLGVLMLLQMRLNPSTGDELQQKVMMYVMPVMFTAMMLFLPSGLVIYIAVNTVLGIAQQWYMLRRAADEPAPVPTKRRKEAT
ncbi:MAG: membrane protein insertase YidC, partial [Myxococcales bacterium]|nr:membrane protein insertase YidC [Myxococcales bacterium]